MKNTFKILSPMVIALTCSLSETTLAQHAQQAILFTNATIIDGATVKPKNNTDLLVVNGKIAAVGKNLQYPGAKRVRSAGQFIMPLLISAHSHIGIVKGTTSNAANYTRAHIVEQLEKYLRYGVGNVLSMGTDRPFLFTSGLRDSSISGSLSGARLHSTGMGFGVKNSAPPAEIGADLVYRPESSDEIRAQMDSLALLEPDMVKVWVDDFGGRYKKMEPSIYKQVISEAHHHGLRVAAHAYYLSDARALVDEGVDVIAHSIRDSIIDDQLVAKMKAKRVVYIPSLSLDEYAYIYAEKPEWLQDPFFKASLEPGVYEMITSGKYQADLRHSPAFQKNQRAFKIALANLVRLFKAGILIAMGTDSGAMPVRAQGFSEHLELELMVRAGLTPTQAIMIGTQNSAAVLKVDKLFGTLQVGKMADLLILSADPLKDIRNTRKIKGIYKAGKFISGGPL